MATDTFTTSIKPLGDAALIVYLGKGITPPVQAAVSQLVHAISIQPFTGFIEAVPAYNSVTVYYNPYTVALATVQVEHQHITSYEKVSTYILQLLDDLPTDERLPKQTIEIPVIYGGEFGPDLSHVANFHGLSMEEVIQIHSGNSYLVYMIGFAPGFPFLGGLNEGIATPRKESPRPRVPAGSVGIAGKQTGVYPLETPGGWQIIGQTPIDLFLPNETPPTLLRAGDVIRFIPITPEEYSSKKRWRK